jgi:two-component system response regulator YesN
VTSILVVDDEPDILYLLSMFVQDAFPKARVVTARTGTEGLGILEKGPVDAIVSDYRMPGMDGIEFLQQARSRYPACGRILMTAFADSRLEPRARSSGVHSFIEKTEDPEDLVLALTEALAKVTG